MQVYDISVRFMRRVQVKEYEPREVEIGIKALIAEGEDHNVSLAKLINEAKSHVALAHGAAAPAAISSDTVVSTVAELPKVTETASAKPVDKKAAAAAAKAAKAVAKSTAAPATTPAKPVVSDDDFAPSKTTSEDDFGGTPATKAAPVAAVAEPVVEDWEKAADVITPQALGTFLSAKISDRTLAVDDVKKILAKYSVALSSQLSESDRAKFKAEIDALIASKK